MIHIWSWKYSFEALKAKILFTQSYRKVEQRKTFKKVDVTFGKMLPDQLPISFYNVCPYSLTDVCFLLTEKK